MFGERFIKNLIALLTPANRTDLPTIEQSARLSARILTLIMAKVVECGAKQCELDLLANEPQYRFTTAEGRTGSGAISSKIREELIDFCDRNLGEIDLGAFKKVRLEGRVNAGVYCLGFGAVKPASQLAYSQRVFVIDDNPTLLKVVQRFLEKQGVTVETFEDGNIALEQMRACLPSAVVCDLHMGKVDGIGVLRKAKSDPRTATVPFVMLTSDDDVDVELKFLELGAEAFISKSADPRILCAHVKRLLEISRFGRKVA